MTRRVLVVDDDVDVRRLAVLSLSKIGGYEVESVESGAACLASLAESVPDVVVLDVNMPDMDGPATLMAIRDAATTHALPVVFLTAGVVEADMHRLESLPVTGLLHKPFDPLQLPAQLAALLGW